MHTDVSDPKRPLETAQTIAAPASSPTDPTLAADATQLTSAPSVPPSTRPAVSRPPSSATTTRKVGVEIAGASIHRFGTVDRSRFEVLDELARGGLGRVFRARDPRTGRIVAIKEVLHPVPEIIARFAREALVTANLQHPSIVPVYEVGTWGDGEPFYAMKLVAGRTLDRVIIEAPTTDARVALVPHVIAVADALAYAHSEGVIHRDLKPSNVIVGAYGETVVIDWGLAKSVAIEDVEDIAAGSTIPPNMQETVAGSVLGTPAYMPPEQARGEPLDEHADVYAIGALLYHMLTGKRPYGDVSDVSELIEAVAKRAVTPILELAPDAPTELVAIAEKAMAREKQDRYPTAQGLATDLRRFQTGKLVGAHRYSRMQLVRRWVQRHAAAVGVASVAVIVLAVMGVISVRRITSERDEAQRQGEIAREREIAANTASAEAKRRLADSLEELGRQALIDNHPERALPMLAAAADSRETATPTLGLLAAQARAAYTGLVAIAPPPKSPATSGALAAGGTRILVADKDGRVSAWDVGARAIQWTVDAGATIAVSPDGTKFLATTADGTLSLRAVEDGHVLDTWKLGAQSSVVTFGWAPDGSRFAFAGDDGRFVIGTPGQTEVVDVGLRKSTTYAVAFSPDSTRVATGGSDGTITISDARTGATVASLRETPREIAAIEWIDNDQLVDGDDKGIVRLWRASQRRVVRRFEQGKAIYALAVGPDWVAAAGDGEVVRTWSLETGALGAELVGHGLGVDVATSAAGWLVTGDELGVVRVWDPRSGERLHAFPSEEELITIDARDGFVAAIARGRQRLWKLAPDAVVHHIQAHTARVRDLVFGPDDTLYTASSDGTGVAVNVAQGSFSRLGSADAFVEQPSRTLAELQVNARANPHGARSIAVSTDGRLVALPFEDGRIEIFDKTGKPVASWQGHTGRVRRVVFAPDDKTAYSVGDTTVRMWDVATGKERGQATLASAGWDVALVDATTLATLGDDPTVVQLWRAGTLESVPAELTSRLPVLAVFRDHLLTSDRASVALLDASGKVLKSVAQSGAFSADASITGQLAVGSSNGHIVLYNADTLAPIREMQLGDAVITRVAFRPDGKVLAAITDRRLELFDPATGKLLARLSELPVLLAQLAWSRDGRYLAVAGAGGMVWIWDVAPANARELDRFAQCVSPWRLEDTTLVKKTFDPESCSILAR
jgi:WD40 repeat protein/tRNA A-37 threonylcarbamoyl transferase component Bud32